MSTVVITGSSKGIGFGLAEEFAKRGWNVVISGRDADSIDAAIEKLGGDRSRFLGVTCDVSRRLDLQALWDKATTLFDEVDIWINNAGLARTIWPILDTPDNQIDVMLATNMPGTINGSIIAARGMIGQGHGKIFNVLGGGSDGEYFPGIGIYGTTKRGLDYFSTALAKELSETGILLGRIRPGMVVTEAVIREIEADRVRFEQSRDMMNNLVDQVETVAPFLVDEMLKFKKHGGKIRWLTGGKIGWRMLKSRFVKRQDQFKRFGL